jgi:hypothetical protein
VSDRASDRAAGVVAVPGWLNTFTIATRSDGHPSADWQRLGGVIFADTVTHAERTVRTSERASRRCGRAGLA